MYRRPSSVPYRQGQCVPARWLPACIKEVGRPAATIEKITVSGRSDQLNYRPVSNLSLAPGAPKT